MGRVVVDVVVVETQFSYWPPAPQKLGLVLQLNHASIYRPVQPMVLGQGSPAGLGAARPESGRARHVVGLSSAATVNRV